MPSIPSLISEPPKPSVSFALFCIHFSGLYKPLQPNQHGWFKHNNLFFFGLIDPYFLLNIISQPLGGENSILAFLNLRQCYILFDGKGWLSTEVFVIVGFLAIDRGCCHCWFSCYRLRLLSLVFLLVSTEVVIVGFLAIDRGCCHGSDAKFSIMLPTIPASI